MPYPSVRTIIDATSKFYSQNTELFWVDDPVEYTYAPGVFDPQFASAPTNTGISVLKDILFHADVRPRMKAGGRTTLLTIPSESFLPTNTYTLTVETTRDGDSASISTTDEATPAAAATSLAADITAEYTGTPEPVATTIDVGNGSKDTVLVFQADVVGGAVADMVLALSGDANSLRAYTDATACKARLWVKRPQPSSEFPPDLAVGWTMLKDFGAVDIDLGLPVSEDVSPYSRAYLELYDVSGDTSEEIARPFLVVGTSKLDA